MVDHRALSGLGNLRLVERVRSQLHVRPNLYLRFLLPFRQTDSLAGNGTPHGWHNHAPRLTYLRCGRLCALCHHLAYSHRHAFPRAGHQGVHVLDIARSRQPAASRVRQMYHCPRSGQIYEPLRVSLAHLARHGSAPHYPRLAHAHHHGLAEGDRLCACARLFRPDVLPARHERPGSCHRNRCSGTIHHGHQVRSPARTDHHCCVHAALSWPRVVLQVQTLLARQAQNTVACSPFYCCHRLLARLQHCIRTPPGSPA